MIEKASPILVALHIAVFLAIIAMLIGDNIGREIIIKTKQEVKVVEKKTENQPGS